MFSKSRISETSVWGHSDFANTRESFGSAPPPLRSLPDFDFLKLLSKSHNSTVFLVRDKCNRQLVALKVIQKSSCSTHQLKFVDSEQQILRSLSKEETQFSLPLLCSWEDTENFYLVTEYIGGGTLAVEILRCKQFEEAKAKFYLAELIVAVEELRVRQIIHRDLKPENIVLTPDGHIRIIDFGYGKQFDSPGCVNFEADDTSDSGSFTTEGTVLTSNESCGTASFMSPEQHRGEDYRDEVDEWAVGTIAYRMLTRRMPFGHYAQSPEEIAHCVQREPLMFQADDCLSLPAMDLVRGMLAKNRRDRLTLAQVKGHAFFEGLDWDMVARQELPAPWKPYIAPAPKQPMAIRPIKKGAEIEEWNPHSYFRYTMVKIDLSKEPSPIDIKNKSQVFQKIGRFFTSAFCQNKKVDTTESLLSSSASASAPEPVHDPTPTPMACEKRDPEQWHGHIDQAFSPASPGLAAKRGSLRPLLLPRMVSEKLQMPTYIPTCILSEKSFQPEAIRVHVRAQFPGTSDDMRIGRNIDVAKSPPEMKQSATSGP